MQSSRNDTPNGISSGHRLSQHFLACAAALTTVASVGTAHAGVITWDANLVIPNNIDGQYINVETQAYGTAAGLVAGWDLNPYGTSTTAMSWFAAAAPSAAVQAELGALSPAAAAYLQQTWSQHVDRGYRQCDAERAPLIHRPAPY